MKHYLFIFSFLLILTSCHRHSCHTCWQDMKMSKGLNCSQSDSRLLLSSDQFTGPGEGDFIPMAGQDLKKYSGDTPVPQPDKCLVGFEQFYEPPSTLRSLFQHLHFRTDKHVLDNKEDILAISQMAEYLINNPKMYLIVEGHCDERASADYNMALGLRRAQYVRVLLCKKGVHPGRVYTISYGKEKPISLGHEEMDWKQNRRAQFKLYEE